MEEWAATAECRGWRLRLAEEAEAVAQRPFLHQEEEAEADWVPHWAAAEGWEPPMRWVAVEAAESCLEGAALRAPQRREEAQAVAQEYLKSLAQAQPEEEATEVAPERVAEPTLAAAYRANHPIPALQVRLGASLRSRTVDRIRVPGLRGGRKKSCG